MFDVSNPNIVSVSSQVNAHVIFGHRHPQDQATLDKVKDPKLILCQYLLLN